MKLILKVSNYIEITLVAVIAFDDCSREPLIFQYYTHENTMDWLFHKIEAPSWVTPGHLKDFREPKKVMENLENMGFEREGSPRGKNLGIVDDDGYLFLESPFPW